MVSCGCRSNTRQDVLEAELRARDRTISKLRGELAAAQMMSQALEHEFLDTPLSKPHPEQFAGQPVATVLGSPLKEIELARGTGGIDDDGQPGDEALMVVVVPKDHDGSEVKAAGTLRVSAYEITESGVKLPLSTWEVPALNLRRKWKSGLFSTGYHVRLEWKNPPTTERLRVVAQLTLLTGQVYEADRDVKIRRLPHARRAPVVMPVPCEPPVVPMPPIPEIIQPTGPGLPSSEPPESESEGLPLPRPHSSSYRAWLLPPRPSRD